MRFVDSACFVPIFAVLMSPITIEWIINTTMSQCDSKLHRNIEYLVRTMSIIRKFACNRFQLICWFNGIFPNNYKTFYPHLSFRIRIKSKIYLASFETFRTFLLVSTQMRSFRYLCHIDFSVCWCNLSFIVFVRSMCTIVNFCATKTKMRSTTSETNSIERTVLIYTRNHLV